MDIEEHLGPPRGLLLGLGVVAIVLAGALAGEFVFRLQPALTTGETRPRGSCSCPWAPGATPP